MKLLKTTLENADGSIVENKGTSLMAIQATREGENVNVNVDFCVASDEEVICMVGMLLTMLEEKGGENLAAQCIAKYADETGKIVKRKEGVDIAWIKGREKE